MGELKTVIPTDILPRSLGGLAAFGDDGECCAGVVHTSFLGGSDSSTFEDAVSVLESFVGVAPSELEAVNCLRRELERDGDLSSALPADLGGALALLRFVRKAIISEERTTLDEFRAMLQFRDSHKSDQARAEIL